MRVIHLLTTNHNQTGPYVSVEDQADLTIQVVSTGVVAGIAIPLNGTVVIEGTVDTDPATARWSPLFTTVGEEIRCLAGYTLAGLRVITKNMIAGEVTVNAATR